MRNSFSSHFKNILHGFFLAIATTIAEPSAILPLIVNHFSANSFLIGFFAFLLRGGAIIVQLFAAFYAQSFSYVLPYLRRVFFARFFSWFMIGTTILVLGEQYKNLTLFFIGIWLFLFSFSAGFGAIYFKEILAKVFTKEFLGTTMGWRQFFAGIGAVLSGIFAGNILEKFSPPYSYGYLFIISSLLMSIGLIAFGTIKEPKKENIRKREENFYKFLKNSIKILKGDRNLKIQILVIFLSYSYLLSIPFVIIEAKEKIELSGFLVGAFLSTQMSGAMIGSLLWGKLSSLGKNKEVVMLSFLFLIFVFVFAVFAPTFSYLYFMLFFLLGAATDGFRLAGNNLILVISPPEKRPIYVALQANLTSLGLLFPLIGGVLLNFLDYFCLYIFSSILLGFGLFLSFFIKEKHSNTDFSTPL